MSDKNNTSRSERFYIGIFGRRNSGKSSLLNILAGQDIAIVSDIPGTTTDVVQKNIELPGIGASVIVDTAGYDDTGMLGEKRVEQTRKALSRMNMALLVVSGCPDEAVYEKAWLKEISMLKIPVLCVYNKYDKERYENLWTDILSPSHKLVCVSAMTGYGIDNLRSEMSKIYSENDDKSDLTAGIANCGDVVVLVMPQDIQAPKGRLILPQVQTIRNLLDKGCVPVCCTMDNLSHTLDSLKAPPSLIITDSQVFAQVEPLCPANTMLTSFSVLFACYKGDADSFRQGAHILMNLDSNARILIAEACTHVPQNEDIGRVKLPALLRRRLGKDIHIDIVSGNDFPDDLSAYSLVIHCGACMFTRRHVLSRLSKASSQSVPMTNYGMALAALNGILDKIVFPEKQ